MAYPARGAWSFYNVTRSFSFTPTLDSILISQELPDLTASLSCRVVDEDAALAFQEEDQVRVVFDGERIWAGHIKSWTEDSVSVLGPRVWDLEGQDYTAKLSDAIIHRRQKRKREKAVRRVRWLLRQLDRRIWSLAGKDLSDIPDEYVEAYDYFGATVDEGLAHVAEELNLHYYIDFDNRFQMYRSESVLAPFALDNEAPNYATTFPFRDWTYATDSVELANAILVEPEKRKHSRWTVNAASIAAYGRQERFVSDGNLHRPAQALAMGARTVALSKDPEEEGTLLVFQPGLQAGQTVHVREALWDHDFSKFIRAVDIRAVDPEDESGEAYLFTEVTLSDKPRRRLRGRQPGHRKSVNRNTRRRPGQTADVDPHPVDTFSRIVLIPTFDLGDPIEAEVDGYSASTIYRRYGVGYPTAVEVTAGPTFAIGPAAGKVESLIGQDATPWTQQGGLGYCGGLSFWFAGWRDVEAWWSFAVPAHPAGMAGVQVSIALGAGTGVATQYGAEVVVLPSEPTANWQGDSVGYVGAAGGDVTIPGALVPAEGGRLHIGIRPAWRCDYDETMCGWNYPVASGYANSGTFASGAVSSPNWLVYTDAGGDMGDIATPAAAPWQGGNEWREAGIEGSPSFGVDGSAYFVTSTGLGGRGLYVVGEREDVDEPDGPWSDCAWACEVEFEVDASGDTGTSGPRHIQVTTTGEGEQTVGTVHLGDSGDAEGISVGGPTTTDYTAKAMGVDERWMVRFDSRSGKMRGKLWKVTDGEPAAWDVSVPMAQTEDDGDRFLFWVRCGNATEQTVKVHRIRAQVGGHDGQRVVREWLGFASGLTSRFQTNHPFREGTLMAHVNGVNVPPTWEDGDEGEFTIDFYPTAHSAMRATYIVDQGG